MSSGRRGVQIPRLSPSRESSVVSVNLDSEQLEFLAQPSPYHEDFPESDTWYRGSAPEASKIGGLFHTFSKLFKRPLYQKMHSDQRNVSRLKKRPGRKEDERGIGERYRKEEAPADRWFMSIFLLLLFSGLFNLFLIFNGPPPSLPRLQKETVSPLPHDAFYYQEDGKNYTCFGVRNGAFKPNTEFQSTAKEYDYLWDELVPKSKGYVYTSTGREDGKIRKARLGMFTQLECLSKLRKVIQTLREGGNIEVGMKDGDADWEQCLGYLGKVTLCNADDSLELSEVVHGHWESRLFGQTRRCRSPNWLFEIMECGEQGCGGLPFYHDDEAMRMIRNEESQDLKVWETEKDTDL